MKKKSRWLHAWFGMSISLFVLGLAVTGLFLNHPELLQSKSSNQAFEQHPHTVFVNKSGRYYIATEKGLFTSEDGGKTNKPLRLPYAAKSIVSIFEWNEHLYIATESGLLASSKQDKFRWKREELPAMNMLYSVTVSRSGPVILGDTGLFEWQDGHWVLLKKNNSPMDLYYTMKAIHTGYMPFSWLKIINSIAAVGLIILTVTGWVLFKRRFRKF